MIGSYRDKRTRGFAEGKRVKAFDGIAHKLGMKLISWTPPHRSEILICRAIGLKR